MSKSVGAKFKPEQLVSNWRIVKVLGQSFYNTDRRWKYLVECINCGAESEKWQSQIVRETNYCIECRGSYKKQKPFDTIDVFEAVKKGELPDFITMRGTK